MKVRVVDFESTGLPGDHAKHAICEIGWTDIDDAGTISRPQSRLVNPGMPIPPEARGVHHISDEVVADAMRPGEALMLLMAGMELGDMFAAHNTDMERAFFGGGPHPWICTLKTAKHLWEDAPGYSNQTLRYWLHLDEVIEWPELMHPVHRAGPDSYVSAHILGRMLMMKPAYALVDLTNTPILLKKVQSGKYQGELWSSMDNGYLEFILDPSKGPFKPEVLYTARYWLNKNRGLTGTPFA